MPANASSTTRWALLTVLSETSYGGDTSTTSSATRFASVARRRTVLSRSAGAIPPGGRVTGEVTAFDVVPDVARADVYVDAGFG
jgi:hypothetical protein